MLDAEDQTQLGLELGNCPPHCAMAPNPEAKLSISLIFFQYAFFYSCFPLLCIIALHQPLLNSQAHSYFLQRVTFLSPHAIRASWGWWTVASKCCAQAAGGERGKPLVCHLTKAYPRRAGLGWRKLNDRRMNPAERNSRILALKSLLKARETPLRTPHLRYSPHWDSVSKVKPDGNLRKTGRTLLVSFVLHILE